MVATFGSIARSAVSHAFANDTLSSDMISFLHFHSCKSETRLPIICSAVEPTMKNRKCFDAEYFRTLYSCNSSFVAVLSETLAFRGAVQLPGHSRRIPARKDTLSDFARDLLARICYDIMGPLRTVHSSSYCGGPGDRIPKHHPDYCIYCSRRLARLAEQRRGIEPHVRRGCVRLSKPSRR
jgi:hypothetical protein